MTTANNCPWPRAAASLALLRLGAATGGVLAVVASSWPGPARASDSLGIERSLAQFVVVQNERRHAARQRERKSAASQAQALAGQGRPPEAPVELKASQNRAVLPQIGYDPEVGFIGGGKFSAINFGPSHMNLDIAATQSTGGETEADATWGVPRVFGSDFIGLVSAQYVLRPTQGFYGLGNNNVGDDALSQHEYHRTSIMFTLGRRLAPHWVLAGTIGYDRVSIGTGHPQHGKPATTAAFPDLPGLSGGYNNPLSLSLVYNTQRDLTRPQQGWNAIAKIQHVGPELGNDFRYTRYIIDASYVHPVVSRKNLIGVRVDGEYVDGRGDNLPFYEFATIGGFDSLLGYEPNRFIGQSRVFARIGYQRELAEFQFRHLWRVRLDSSLFAGAGRVFLNRSRLPQGLLQHTSQVAPGLSNALRYSYGGGLKVALGEALVARLDVGFSPESSGLVYLSFGNAF